MTLRHHGGQTELVRARYLVGCDGANSTVRPHAGVVFKGGAQGMNSIRDASNLGWKLALALRGTASEALLDSYGVAAPPPRSGDRADARFQ